MSEIDNLREAANKAQAKKSKPLIPDDYQPVGAVRYREKRTKWFYAGFSMQQLWRGPSGEMWVEPPIMGMED